MSTGIASIRWYGGKSRDKTGTWIASKLPPAESYSTYVETHCGMLGVLLLRPKVNVELVNDLNSRLMNFWEVLIHDIDGLYHMASHTPHSRELFDKCAASLDEGTPLERAWKFYVVITQSLTSSDNNPKWYRAISCDNKHPARFERRFHEIRQRVIGVQLENRPAIDILRRVVDEPQCVVYVDPPYAGTENSPYAHVRHDRAETLELLQAQRGKVAVSGFDDEWDELGWMRHEREKSVNVTLARTRRLEVLWTNYELDPRLL